MRGLHLPAPPQRFLRFLAALMLQRAPRDFNKSCRPPLSGLVCLLCSPPSAIRRLLEGLNLDGKLTMTVKHHPVVARLKDFCRLWCDRDLETHLSFLSTSRETVMYGTGKD